MNERVIKWCIRYIFLFPLVCFLDCYKEFNKTYILQTNIIQTNKKTIFFHFFNPTCPSFLPSQRWRGRVSPVSPRGPLRWGAPTGTEPPRRRWRWTPSLAGERLGWFEKVKDWVGSRSVNWTNGIYKKREREKEREKEEKKRERKKKKDFVK